MIMQKTIGQLLGGQPITTPDFLQLLTSVLVVMAIIDLIRNLIIGFLFPAHAIAHVIGEVLSLTLFCLFLRSALGPIHHTVTETFSSVCLSVVIMIFGIVVRAYVEWQEYNM